MIDKETIEGLARRNAFEARYKTELDKRALQKNEQGQYILMSTYQAWVNYQIGWEDSQTYMQEQMQPVVDALDVGAHDYENPPDYVQLRDAVIKALASLPPFMKGTSE